MTNYKDTDLREALRRRYSDTPQLSADFADRLMQRIESPKNRAKLSRFSSLSLWRGRGARLVGIAAAAASILLLLTLHHYNNRGGELKEMPLAKTQTVAADSSSNIKNEPMPTKVVEIPLVAKAEKPQTHTKKKYEPQKKQADTSSAAEELAKAIARLEAEMESLEDSVSSAQMEKLIAADARLQRLVFNIVGKQTEQAMNQILKDSTANYINF